MDELSSSGLPVVCVLGINAFISTPSWTAAPESHCCGAGEGFTMKFLASNLFQFMMSDYE